MWTIKNGPISNDVTLYDETTLTPTFDVPLINGNGNKSVTFELEISDGTNTVTDEVIVTVTQQP